MAAAWALLNGEMVEAGNARVSVDDRGFILGDGLFETMRAYGGRLFRLAAHLERLYASGAAFNIRLPWPPEQMAGMAGRLLEKNGLDSARVRITVTRGRHSGAMSLAPTESPTLFISAEPLSDQIAARAERGIKLMTAAVRFSENNPTFRHKTLNRLPHLAARTQAEAAGGDEALILDERGNAACCSTGNIFALQYGQLFTPPLTGPILPGITRGVILRLAAEENIPIRENYFSPLILAGADEAFMTNSIQEIVPVVEANHRPVGSGRPGPVASMLLEKYRKAADEME
ncbi:MAG TPA: aminotransferase class IV [bacterium]|nr:aminotransferase class IV [bacterium]